MSERPRERLQEKGVEALSTQELLALLLRTGTRGVNVEMLARGLLKENSLLGLSRLNIEQLMDVKGISFAKATTLVSAFELVRRVHDCNNNRVVFTSSKEVISFVETYFSGLSYERVLALYVSTKNTLIKAEIMHEGSIDFSIIEPRKIVKRALELQASGIFILHNHPSGDPKPSTEDRNVTKRVKEVCELLHLRFLDHIIYGSAINYYSFFDNDEV